MSIKDDLGSRMSKYTVDVFTEQSVGSKFPENSYDAEDIEMVSKIISNCTRDISGIRQVQIWINEPDDRNPIVTK